MIKYNPGYWGLFFICRIRGSVFPKALVVAVPNGLLALAIHYFYRKPAAQSEGDNHDWILSEMWSGYTFVLGFLIVFRTNQAYSRFWEGATLVHQIRGEWFNATSNLISFCSMDPLKKDEVHVFQHLLVRLMSMLYCSALQQVCDLQDDSLEIIDSEGMEQASLDFLTHVNDRCEVLLQWLQRLTLDADERKILKIAPPILSRVFQEYSRGIVNLNSVRKIKEIPFPFPFAQMITCMLMIYWIITPMYAGMTNNHPAWVFFLCVSVNCSYWCLMYISIEIDQPFGDDWNDLPIAELQRDFNLSLCTLLQPLAQKPPAYSPPVGMQRTVTHFVRSDQVVNSAGEMSWTKSSDDYLQALENLGQKHKRMSRLDNILSLDYKEEAPERVGLTLATEDAQHKQAPPDEEGPEQELVLCGVETPYESELHEVPGDQLYDEDVGRSASSSSHARPRPSKIPTKGELPSSWAPPEPDLSPSLVRLHGFAVSTELLSSVWQEDRGSGKRLCMVGAMRPIGASNDRLIPE